MPAEVGNQFSCATSFAEVPDVSCIVNDEELMVKLCSIVYKDKNTKKFMFKPPLRNWLFKLSDVTLAGIESKYNANAGFSFSTSSSSSDLKMTIMLNDGNQFLAIKSWFDAIFPGLSNKTAEEFKNNCKEPRKHVPLKISNGSGSPMTILKIGADTTVCFDQAVPGVKGDLVSQGHLNAVEYGLYKDKRADVYIRVSDLWCSDECYGLKMNIVHLNVKNKLF